ncbi:HNH endonuclease signature motif containing protein [Tenacibaculum maritimum]|nr:HNH endonuclease signature motif containing protein [Tenacibaculum maritimum]MDB0602341.1 HNH endonuclease signature motif containing protein [Tenacibaculum maritimum]MDB0613498.1 HNH endonuclease signature motif containing protein [Tenacibaculum maritimum]
MHDDKGNWFPNELVEESNQNYIPKRVQVLIDNGSKAECKCCYSREYLTFDHINPTSKGGKDDNNNGQILCSRCNSIKSNKLISIKKLRKLVK